MIKKVKIGKTKSKNERIKSDVPLKNFNISSPFLISSFLASFSFFFCVCFSNRDKNERCLCGW
ncbi:MAG: hypothetical protein Q8844_02980, partial [Pigeon pea little leaf phytoplasma]|nr:hypothetical protein [Pigeon pea little leaf phytoplasma]